MSLDVALLGVEEDVECPHCGVVSKKRERLYEANVTHNLVDMAKAAGLYPYIWRPEEAGISEARYLIFPLERGYNWLMDNAGESRKHNPDNGWGSYETFVCFVYKYLCACKCHPAAIVQVSR